MQCLVPGSLSIFRSRASVFVWKVVRSGNVSDIGEVPVLSAPSASPIVCCALTHDGPLYIVVDHLHELGILSNAHELEVLEDLVACGNAHCNHFAG